MGHFRGDPVGVGVEGQSLSSPWCSLRSYQVLMSGDRVAVKSQCHAVLIYIYILFNALTINFLNANRRPFMIYIFHKGVALLGKKS